MTMIALALATAVSSTPYSPLALREPFSAEPASQAPKRAVLLAQYYPVAPVPAPRVYVDTGVNFFLLGLGLMAGGLVLGGAGFAVLYYCQQGTGCYNDTTQTVGWILAAPGIIPFVVGAVMVRISLSGRVAAAPARRPSRGFAFVPAVIPGGGVVGVRGWF
jgi:hypothetical protein